MTVQQSAKQRHQRRDIQRISDDEHGIGKEKIDERRGFAGVSRLGDHFVAERDERLAEPVARRLCID